MSAIFIIAAPYLYKIFFPKYIESVIYSQAYILAAAIAATTSFCVSYMFATRSSKIFYYNAINPVVNIGGIVLGAYLFGIWGVIGARVVGSTFSLLFSFLMEK
jgi:O-antigen/teichoic acid export membrane protein